MKVKILESSDWYKHFVGSEFEFDQYVVDDYLGIHIEDTGWIYKQHCVITELPESFCVKRCDDNKKWYKYLEWLVKQKNFSISMFGRVFVGVLDGVIGEKLHYDDLYPFGTEIHIDDMIKHIDYMERHIKGGEQFHKESQLTVKMDKILKEETNMNTQRLSRQGLKEIHSVACARWKNILEQYGSRNPLEDYIELSQEEVNQMFDACTKEQLPIVSKYLKQDDGSIDVTKFNVSGKGFCDDNFYIIRDREHGEYKRKSFLISEQYNWEIKKDKLGQLCLIPTKKK